MALPPKTKTWQISPNNVALADTEHTISRKLMWGIKEVLINFASNPWTIAGSSDGVTAGMDAVDRWTAWTNLLWGTGAHSWIVFNHPSGAQILFDQKYTNLNCEDMDVRFSNSAAFTGGSTTAAPTATDNVATLIMRSSGVSENWWNGQATSGTYAAGADIRYHIWHSADGLCTRILMYRLGIPVALWRFENIADPRAGHTNPFACCGFVASSPITNDALASSKLAAVTSLYTIIGGAKVALIHWGMGSSSQLWNATSYASVIEETDGEILVTDMAVASYVAGYRGPKGKVFDMWWSQYQVLNPGDTSPADPSARDFVHFEAICLPWTGDATVPLTS